MVHPSGPPLFSVVIPTRNRPALLQRALESVLAQRGPGIEVLVVDDGSTGADAAAGLSLQAALEGRVRWLRLPQRARGHGPSFARNSGADLALGRYLCFLDDDDVWTDPGHLQRCADSIAGHATPVDLYFGHQAAVHADGSSHPGPLWLQGLQTQLAGAPDTLGSHRVSATDLLRAPGFAHLNCTVIRTALFHAISGFDEALRYEEDRDLYYRAIDAAGGMLFNPTLIARHHIPDPTAQANASTATRVVDRRLQQLRICDKLITSAQLAALRRHGREAKGHTLKRLSRELWDLGRKTEAVCYMREALGVAFTAKWLAYTTARALQDATTGNPRL